MWLDFILAQVNTRRARGAAVDWTFYRLVVVAALATMAVLWVVLVWRSFDGRIERGIMPSVAKSTVYRRIFAGVIALTVLGVLAWLMLSQDFMKRFT